MALAQVTAQRIALQGQAAMMQDPATQALMMLQQGMEAGGGAGGGESSSGNRPGRPPSGAEPPRLEQKGSLTNPRNSTISES